MKSRDHRSFDVERLAVEFLAAGLPVESIYLTSDPEHEDDELVVSDQIDVVSGSMKTDFAIYRQTEARRKFLFRSDSLNDVVFFLKHYLARKGAL